MSEQVRFAELVADPVYKKWLLKPRADHPVAKAPWRVFVQMERGGPWAKKDHAHYADAVKFAAKMAKRNAHDLAVHHSPAPVPQLRLKRVVGKRKGVTVHRYVNWLDLHPALADRHQWCCLCRRPTIFRKFGRHHALPRNMPVNQEVTRCSICGASAELAWPQRRRS